MVRVEPIRKDDREMVVELVARFRVELAGYSGREAEMDIQAARQELDNYLEKGYPVFVARKAQDLAGYLVCRVQDSVVWAESLYVLPAYRKRGIGSLLYAKGEELAEKKGNSTVYNWVHPNNHYIIKFLAKRGYDVLNLVEIRKRQPAEKEDKTQKIKVGQHSFNYPGMSR